MTYIFSVFVVVAGRGLRDGCTCTASAIPPLRHKKLCCLSVVVRDGDVCGWKAAAAVCTASKLISMLKSIELSGLLWVIYSSKLFEYLLCWWHIWGGHLEHSSWQVEMMSINLNQNQLLLFDIFKSLKLKVKRKVNNFMTFPPLYKSVMMCTMVV